MNDIEQRLRDEVEQNGGRDTLLTEAADTIHSLTDERDDLARVHRAECEAIDKAVRELVTLRARLARYEELEKAARALMLRLRADTDREVTGALIAALAALDTKEQR